MTDQENVEQIIANVVFPNNPHMSGDQRRWLSPPAQRRVEEAARQILEELDGRPK
jgi:hypothetical protein